MPPDVIVAIHEGYGACQIAYRVLRALSTAFHCAIQREGAGSIPCRRTMFSDITSSFWFFTAFRPLINSDGPYRNLLPRVFLQENDGDVGAFLWIERMSYVCVETIIREAYGNIFSSWSVAKNGCPQNSTHS